MPLAYSQYDRMFMVDFGTLQRLYLHRVFEFHNKILHLILRRYIRIIIVIGVDICQKVVVLLRYKPFNILLGYVII